MDKIKLSVGDGGKEYREFLENNVFKYLGNGILEKAEDSSVLSKDINDVILMTTDSFVIDPIFFPGGDIGKLAVCGTANDISVAGGIPKYFSLSFVIEEGFRVSNFNVIMKSIKDECDKSDIKIVCGDLKVLPANTVDKIFINTTGIGVPLENMPMGYDKIEEGDVLITSSELGQHGASVMFARENYGFKGEIKSDCRNIFPAINKILKDNNHGIKMMRDVTRGGLAAVLNEIKELTGLSPVVEEDKLPFDKAAEAFFEALGLELIHSAGEGVFIIVCKKENANKILSVLKSFKEFYNAAIIGEIQKRENARAILITVSGAKRIIIDHGNTMIPRIC